MTCLKALQILGDEPIYFLSPSPVHWGKNFWDAHRAGFIKNIFHMPVSPLFNYLWSIFLAVKKYQLNFDPQLSPPGPGAKSVKRRLLASKKFNCFDMML